MIKTDRKLIEIYEQKCMPHFRCCHPFDHNTLHEVNTNRQ